MDPCVLKVAKQLRGGLSGTRMGVAFTPSVLTWGNAQL
ncbi:hypothetical protein LINPERPRIM_LOCUS18621 [Linum perenne]